MDLSSTFRRIFMLPFKEKTVIHSAQLIAKFVPKDGCLEDTLEVGQNFPGLLLAVGPSCFKTKVDTQVTRQRTTRAADIWLKMGLLTIKCG